MDIVWILGNRSNKPNMLLVLGVNISRPNLKWISLTLITLGELGRVFKRMNLTPRAYNEIVKNSFVLSLLLHVCHVSYQLHLRFKLKEH